MTIDPQNLEQGKLTVFFRTSERVTKPGFGMLVVCFKPNEENFDNSTFIPTYKYVYTNIHIHNNSMYKYVCTYVDMYAHHSYIYKNEKHF